MQVGDPPPPLLTPTPAPLCVCLSLIHALCVSTRVCVCVRVRACVYVRACASVRACVRACLSVSVTHTHTHTHTRARARAHGRMYALTHACVSVDHTSISLQSPLIWCIGSAQWLERQTRDRKVADSSPGRAAGEFSSPGSTFCADS